MLQTVVYALRPSFVLMKLFKKIQELVDNNLETLGKVDEVVPEERVLVEFFNGRDLCGLQLHLFA